MWNLEVGGLVTFIDHTKSPVLSHSLYIISETSKRYHLERGFSIDKRTQRVHGIGAISSYMTKADSDADEKRRHVEVRIIDSLEELSAALLRLRARYKRIPTGALARMACKLQAFKETCEDCT